MTHRMTIGWIEEFVRDGMAVDGFEVRDDNGKRYAVADHNVNAKLPALALCGLAVSIATHLWLRGCYRS